MDNLVLFCPFFRTDERADDRGTRKKIMTLACVKIRTAVDSFMA